MQSNHTTLRIIGVILISFELHNIELYANPLSSFCSIISLFLQVIVFVILRSEDKFGPFDPWKDGLLGPLDSIFVGFSLYFASCVLKGNVLKPGLDRPGEPIKPSIELRNGPVNPFNLVRL